jgi:hypothetical protein
VIVISFGRRRIFITGLYETEKCPKNNKIDQ